MDVEKLKAILAALQGTDVTRLTWTTVEGLLARGPGQPGDVGPLERCEDFLELLDVQ